MTSDTNSVFLSSSQISNNFGNVAFLPPVSKEVNSDSESEGGSNVDELLSYERMKEVSKRSMLIMPVSQSEVSINSFLSESSQNLLGEDYESQEENNKHNDSSSETNSRPVSLHDCNEKIEIESYAGSGTFSNPSVISDDQIKPEVSPRTSVSSDQDLINFEIDLARETSKQGLDVQSIDSHMFTLIDNESFNNLKSPATISNDGIAEATEEEEENSAEETIAHVRFAEGKENLVV